MASVAETAAAPPTPQRPPLSGLAALMARGGPGGGGWATLPPNVLSAIFDRLPLDSLAAAASVCSAWRYEAALDARWRAFWHQQVSDTSLWQWAKAAGGQGRAGAGRGHWNAAARRAPRVPAPRLLPRGMVGMPGA